MPIRFRCPNEGCGKNLTVKDEAAGRAGKCPACGGPLVVPQLAPPDEPLLLEPWDDGPDDHPGASAAVADPVLTRVTEAPAAAAAVLPVIRFEALGYAWRLLKANLGTWVLATLVMGLGLMGLQIAVGLLSIPGQIAEGLVFRGALPFSPVALGVFALNLALQGLFTGGMYRLALKQVDGETVRVGQLLNVRDVIPALMLGSLLYALGFYIGLFLLVIPGLIFAGLSMFTMPLIVDRRLGGVEAIGASWAALNRCWLQATLFQFVLLVVLLSGFLLCGLGLFVTLPLYCLAVAAQYRGFFPGQGKPKAVADPWAELDGARGGVPEGAGSRGRVPAWAWGLVVVGLIAPAVLLAAVFVVGYSMIRAAREKAREQQQAFALRQQQADPFQGMRDALEKQQRGQAGGGAPQGDPFKALADEMEKELRKQGQADPFQGMRDALEKEMRKQAGAGLPKGKAGVNPAGPRPGPNPNVARGRQPGPANRAVPPAPGGQAARPGPGPAPAPASVPVDVDRALAGLSGDAFARGDALGALIVADPDVPRRAEVARALEPLLSDRSVRADASRALAVWATKENVPALIGALNSDDGQVRRSALWALGRLGDGRAISPVAQRLADPGDRAEAGKALVALGPTAAPEVRKLLDHPDRAVRSEAVAVLGRLGGDAADLKLSLDLSDLKDPDGRTRARALNDLSRANPDSPRRAEVAGAVAPLLGDPEPNTRAAAARALGVWGTGEDVPALAKALDDPERAVQRQALDALVKLKDPRASAPVAALLANDALRHDAVRALRTIGNDAEDEVANLLRHPEADVRLAACQVLQSIGTKASIPALRRLLTDPKKEVASAARAAASAIDPTQVRKKR
jgi:HEAT repeat protein